MQVARGAVGSQRRRQLAVERAQAQRHGVPFGRFLVLALLDVRVGALLGGERLVLVLGGQARAARAGFERLGDGRAEAARGEHDRNVLRVVARRLAPPLYHGRLARAFLGSKRLLCPLEHVPAHARADDGKQERRGRRRLRKEHVLEGGERLWTDSGVDSDVRGEGWEGLAQHGISDERGEHARVAMLQERLQQVEPVVERPPGGRAETGPKGARQREVWRHLVAEHRLRQAAVRDEAGEQGERRGGREALGKAAANMPTLICETVSEPAQAELQEPVLADACLCIRHYQQCRSLASMLGNVGKHLHRMLLLASRTVVRSFERSFR